MRGHSPEPFLSQRTLFRWESWREGGQQEADLCSGSLCGQKLSTLLGSWTEQGARREKGLETEDAHSWGSQRMHTAGVAGGADSLPPAFGGTCAASRLL